MGGGASSLIRLRKALVIRAYNLRKTEQTLDEQFRPHAQRENGVLYIRLDEVSRILCVDASGAWMEELFHQIMVDGSKDKRMRFHDFIEFLETGKVVPVEVIQSNLIENTNNGENGSSSIPLLGNANTATITSLNYNSSMSNLLAANNKFSGKNNDNAGGGGIPRILSSTNARVDNAIAGMHGQEAPPFPPSESDNTSSPSSKANGHNSTNSPIVDLADTLPNGSKTLKPTMSTELIPLGYHKMTVPVDNNTNKVVKPLWKKREVNKQERIIHYTTVDAEGVVQELIEKETSETEVLHMECRETGEFAHRETTIYEQKETFNNETVGEQFGTEEYVHMRSQDDEYEFRDSNMPPRQGQSEPPMSPEGEHYGQGAGSTPKGSPGDRCGVADRDEYDDNDGASGGGHGYGHRAEEDEDGDGDEEDHHNSNSNSNRQQQYTGGSFSPNAYGGGKSEGLRSFAGDEHVDVRGEMSDEEDVHPYQHDIDGADTGTGANHDDNMNSNSDNSRERRKYKRSNATPVSDLSDNNSSGAPTPAPMLDINTGADTGADIDTPGGNASVGIGANSGAAGEVPRVSRKPKRSGSGVRFATSDDENCDNHSAATAAGSRSESGGHEVPNSPERKQKLSSLFGGENENEGEGIGIGMSGGGYVHNDRYDLGDNADLLSTVAADDLNTENNYGSYGNGNTNGNNKGKGRGPPPMSPKVPRSPKSQTSSSFNSNHNSTNSSRRSSSATATPTSVDDHLDANSSDHMGEVSDAPPLLRQTSSMHEID